jgi:hypothetical protein
MELTMRSLRNSLFDSEMKGGSLYAYTITVCEETRINRARPPYKIPVAHTVIEFSSFKTGRVTEVAALAKPFRPWTNLEGLSGSADGHWLLFTQEDRADMDIILVDNFR